MAFIEKKDFLKISAIFLFTRILILIVGTIGFAIFPQQGESYKQTTAREVITNPQKIWNQFDSVWFIRMVEEGYPGREFTDDKMETWGFMPLYSFTIRAIKNVTGFSPFWIGVVISNIFSLLAMLIFFKLLKEKFGQGVETVSYVLIGAGSFYLSIVYSEGLFVLLTAIVFYLTHKKQFALALIFAGLATVTRIQGCLLYIIPGIQILVDQKWNFYRYIPAFLISLFPLGVFIFYLNATSGEPLAFIKIQNAWGSKDLYPLQGFVGLVKGYRPVGTFTNSLFWLLTLLIVVSKYKYMPIAYTIFTVAYFLLSTSNEAIYGTTRYILGVLPLFIALGMSRSEIKEGFKWLSLLFLALTLIAFVTNTGSFI